MTLAIQTNGHVLINRAPMGVSVAQTADGTVVKYWVLSRKSAEVKMPCQRYALSCDAPASGVPGRKQFEADLLAALGY